MADVSFLTLAALILVGLVGGIGITALGPGGVLVTIGLFALTPLDPGVVAGTAIVTHVGTGLIGSAAYLRSGHLRERQTRRVAVALSGAALIGTPLGVTANGLVSQRLFGVLLGLFVAVVAALVLWRRHLTAPRRPPASASPMSASPMPNSPTPNSPMSASSASRPPQVIAVASLGFGVAVISGVFGVGGPMLAVPLLLTVGVPLLPALAAAQVQSVVVSVVGSVGFIARGDVDVPLALLVGIPELVGVLLGWKIVRSIPTHRLTLALVVVLAACAPYLAVSSWIWT